MNSEDSKKQGEVTGQDYLRKYKRRCWESFIKGSKNEKYLLTVSDEHIDSVFRNFGFVGFY